MENLDHKISINRVTNMDIQKKDRFTCIHCFNLLLHPKKCSSCPIHYCRKCLELLTNQHVNSIPKTCSGCSNVLVPCDAESYLLAELSYLIISCQFSDSGCTQKLGYDSVVPHEKKCMFKDQICGKCIEKFSYKDFNEHILSCKKENYKIIENKLKHLESRSIEDFEKTKKTIQEIHLKLNNDILFFEKNIIIQKENINLLAKKFPSTNEDTRNTISKVGKKLVELFNSKAFHECKVIYYCKGKNNNCINNGNVIGENPYRNNSCICSSARNSGLIDGEGGIFEVQRIANTFEMLLIGADDVINNLKLHQEECGFIFGICVGREGSKCNTFSDVWGDNPYSGDSNVCLAALNSGAINLKGGVFRVESRPGRNSYNSSNANSVITLEYGYYMSSIYISKLG